MTTGSRRTGRLTGLVVGLALLVAGCGTGESATPDSSSVSTTMPTTVERPSHSGPVVTVPGLPGESSGGPAATGSPSGTAGPSGSGSAAPVSSSPAATPLSTSSPVAPPAASTSAEPKPPPATSTAAATAPTSRSIAVQPCAGCEVLGTASDVAGGFNAALVRTGNGRAALATLDASGKAAGGISVPFGSSFSTPFGGVLPCDDEGYCIVIATQADGHAIASAYRMLSSGSWQDVSGDEGFASETADARAADVDGDGTLEIAVQVDGADGVVWLVYGRSGSAFDVLGCGSGTDPPSASDLSTEACGS